MRILITGANGFVGSNLLRHLALDKKNCIDILSRAKPSKINDYNNFFNISSDKQISESLKDKDFVFHCAGIPNSSKTENELFEVNVGLTKKIAELSIKNNIKKFVFLSSAKVMGESSVKRPFALSQKPNPHTPYAKSKYLAEKEIETLSSMRPTDFFVLRPVVVYGRSSKGNISNLLKYAKLGIPFPFGSFKDSKRNYLSINNLVDLMTYCIEKDNLKPGTYFASDGVDISLQELVEIITNNLWGKSNIFEFPLPVLKAIFFIIGKKEIYQKLSSPFLVDISYTKDQLNWNPKFSMESEIKKLIQK